MKKKTECRTKRRRLVNKIEKLGANLLINKRNYFNEGKNRIKRMTESKLDEIYVRQLPLITIIIFPALTNTKAT